MALVQGINVIAFNSKRRSRLKSGPPAPSPANSAQCNPPAGDQEATSLTATTAASFNTSSSACSTPYRPKRQQASRAQISAPIGPMTNWTGASAASFLRNTQTRRSFNPLCCTMMARSTRSRLGASCQRTSTRSLSCASRRSSRTSFKRGSRPQRMRSTKAKAAQVAYGDVNISIASCEPRINSQTRWRTSKTILWRQGFAMRQRIGISLRRVGASKSGPPAPSPASGV